MNNWLFKLDFVYKQLDFRKFDVSVMQENWYVLL
jgi:hypothetical protein